MFIDFSHNKLVCELITDSFKRAIEERVAPLLAAKYSDSLVGIQLYEDYIADGLILDGSVYYPLTVVTDSGYETEWLCAPFVEGDFPHGAMFTYCGEGELDVTLVAAPEALEAKLSGRRRYFDGKSLSVNITSPVGAAALVGKYSQSFLDLLGERITAEIERVMSVSGLVDSGIYIEMPFAPETYMEHTSESVTFRRLLISDKTSSAKDLFIRWKRLDGKVGYTVSDTPDESNIEIALGEDVPQKIREREYRFLTRVSPNRYQTAMGRKNVTEWRELIKRAIKRGELVKLETPEDKKLAEVSDKLTEIFREIGQPLDTTPAEELISPEYDEDFERAMQALREVANGEMPTAAPTVEPTAEEEAEVEATPEVEAEAEPEAEVEPEAEPEVEVEIYEEAAPEVEASPEVAPEAESAPEVEVALEAEATPELEAVAPTPVVVNSAEGERISLIEAELIALKYQYESLLEENRRLELAAKQGEEERRLLAEKHKAEEEKYRQAIEAQRRAEERERERLKEAAIAELQEKRRLEEQREREAEEQRQREEAEARRLEEERIEREREAERERLAREYEKKQEVNTPPATPINYVSYTATLIFRHSVDPNSISRIRDLIKTTITYFRKDDVKIHIKASMPDNLTVKLDFVQIPENEHDLVVNIIKVLGKSDLGIARAVLTE